MHRFNLASILVLGAAATAYAGQIQVGGTNGLTSSYITSNCAVANCLNAPAPQNQVQSSPAAYSEVGYQTVLFADAANGNATPSVGSTLTDTSAAAVAAAGAGGVTFDLINDGAGNNAWSDGSSGHPTIDIPINLTDVSSVWTMINAENGVGGTTANVYRDAWVTFDFASTAGATTGLTSLTVKLNNTANGTPASGSIQNAIDCTAGCPAGNYSLGANGSATDGASGMAVLDTGSLTSASPNTVETSQITVDTNNLLSFAYTSGGAGTAGDVVLSDQGFIFSPTLLASLPAFLVDIRIDETGTTALSGVALSAVTVETVAISPEPSTILLLLTGLSVIGLAGFRRLRA